MTQRIEAQHSLHVDRGGKPLRKTFHINQWRRLIPQTLVDPDSNQPVTLPKGGWVEIARDVLPKSPTALMTNEHKVPVSLKESTEKVVAKKKPATKKKSSKSKSTPPLVPAEEPVTKEELKFE